MTIYLLDTNIISDVVDDASGRVGQRLERVGRANACTSIVVVAELQYGVEKKRSLRLAQRMARTLSLISIGPVEPPFETVYARLRIDLERRGQMLDANDLIIAAHAITLGCTLVSHDAAFTRVPGLDLEDWLA